MAGATLVRTTLTGVRPLGVRGEPLHHAEAQIRAVVQRRLGEAHFRLLAEPQPHDLGGRIDWYSAVAGPVRALSDLPPADRDAARARIDGLLADIDRLGQGLEASPSEDARLAGRSLRLAAKRPSDDYLFLVGDQPVIVCWGYDTEAAGAVLPPAFLAGTGSTAAAPPAAPQVAVAPPFPVASPASAVMAAQPRTPWLLWLLVGLLAILILLAAAWVLRQFLPVPPLLRVTELTRPPQPPTPPAPPRPGLQDDLDAAQRDADRLRATLASLRDELQRRQAQCRRPVQEPGGDDVLRLPPKPTNDYSFLKGCWRGDTFRYTPVHPAGFHTYCFDEKGNGKLVFRWDTGEVCEAPATARYEGDTLRIADADTTCSYGMYWTQDRLVCRPGADNVAECTGETSMHLPDQGVSRERPTQFSTRLRRQ